MRTLRWEHEGWPRRTWTLVEDGRTLVTWRQRGLGWHGDLDREGRAWRLKVDGLLRWTVRVLDEQGAPRASLPLGWRGQGRVALADGRALAWEADDVWGTRWSLMDEEGVLVARVLADRFFRASATVEVLATRLDDDALVAALAACWASLVVTTQAALAAGG